MHWSCRWSRQVLPIAPTTAPLMACTWASALGCRVLGCCPSCLALHGLKSRIQQQPPPKHPDFLLLHPMPNTQWFPSLWTDAQNSCSFLHLPGHFILCCVYYNFILQFHSIILKSPLGLHMSSGIRCLWGFILSLLPLASFGNSSDNNNCSHLLRA